MGINGNGKKLLGPLFVQKKEWYDILIHGVGGSRILFRNKDKYFKQTYHNSRLFNLQIGFLIIF